MANIPCDEIMTKEVAACGPEYNVRAVARLMLEQHVGSLPIVDSERRLIGVVTDRDLVVRVIVPGLDPDSTPISTVMSKELVTCLPEDDLGEATSRMMEHQIRRLYIVDQHGHVAGVIAQADVASRSGDRNKTAQLVERVSQPGVPEPVPNGMTP